MAKEAHVKKVQIIQDQFVKALQIHLTQNENSARLSDILQWWVEKKSEWYPDLSGETSFNKGYNYRATFSKYHEKSKLDGEPEKAIKLK